MRAYKFNFCGTDRVIVHPLGLPPGWKESNLPLEKEAAILANHESGRKVIHLNPETLEIIETFTIK